MEKFLTSKQIMHYLPYERDTLYKKCRKKEIPHIRMDGRIFFRLSEITSWLISKEQKPRRQPGRKAAFKPEEE